MNVTVPTGLSIIKSLLYTTFLDAIGFRSAQHAIHSRCVTESVLATPTDGFLLQGN